MSVSAVALAGLCCSVQPSSGLVHAARARPVAPVATRRFCTIAQTGGDVASEDGHQDPPKLEPFSQSRLSRAMRERRFLEKAEDALNEKCMTLEGEPAYKCWEALFDYETMMEEAETECKVDEVGERDASCKALERLESMVRQSGGVNSLIDNVRMLTRIRESKKLKPTPDEEEWLKTVSEAVDEVADLPPEEQRHEFLEDGGIPKTLQELQAEIEALLPESSFSRVLKRGKHQS